MRIDFSQKHDQLTMFATLDDDDRKEFGKATLSRDSVTFQLPFEFDVRTVHPDLLALAATISFSPWIGKRLDLSFSVSEDLAEIFRRVLKISLTNVSSWVEPRKPKNDARPGLSFSGGVDSLACLELMPENTVPMFSHRSPAPHKGNTLYRDDAALHAIAELNKSGRTTYSMMSDLEWLRAPVGFGVDPAPAVPLILLSDHFNIDAIAFGTIAEAAYRTGSETYIDYAKRPIFTKWQAAFQAAGLEYFNCVAPLSELCTTKITRESKYGHLAQSCVRGEIGKPCMNCVKCFRKSLIEASFSGNWPEQEEISRMMANRSIKGYLDAAPIRLEIVLASALSQYNGHDPLLSTLKERVCSTDQDVSFTRGWYGPGIDAMVPKKYREGLIDSLNRFIPKMTPQQVRAFEEFDIRPTIEDLQNRNLVSSFHEKLEENQREFNSALKASS